MNLDGEIVRYFSLIDSSGITQQKAGVSAWQRKKKNEGKY